MRRTDQNLIQREVDDVGSCSFNRENQIENCSVRYIDADGSILAGTLKRKYSLDAENALTMTVTLQMITDSPSGNIPFNTFPVRCPDDAIWGILNELAR